MRNTLIALLTILAVLASPTNAFANTTLSTSQAEKLKVINTKIALVQELFDRSIISAEQAAAADRLYCQDAASVVGHEVTVQEIQTLSSNGEKTKGLAVFWDIIIVIAGIVVLFAIVGLIAYYFRELLRQIPKTVYEMLAYGGTVLMALSGYLWQPFHLGIVEVDPLWFVIPGALAVAGCNFLSYKLHFKSGPRVRDSVRRMGPGFINFPTVMFGNCTIAWAAMAIFYHNLFPEDGLPHVLAFSAVIALQAFLGFSVLTMPGCIALGWEDDRQVPKSVFSSLIILAGYVGLKLTNHLTGYWSLFESGAIFMGAFVYYLGLLVMSSKWYCWTGKKGTDSFGRYVALQVVTIISGFAALYFGSVFHLGALLGVGGTFFSIYLLEKYYDFPWQGAGWLWSLLGAGGFLYLLRGFALTHSQYFLWGLK